MLILLEELRQVINSILTKKKVGTLTLGRRRRQRELFFEPGNAYLLNRGNLHRIIISEDWKSLPGITDELLFEIANEIQEANETVPEALLRHQLQRQLLRPPSGFSDDHVPDPHLRRADREPGRGRQQHARVSPHVRPRRSRSIVRDVPHPGTS